MKRTLTLLLALLTVSSTVIACGGKTDPKETKETQETNTGSESVAETEEVKATPNWDSVDKTSLGGMTINITSPETVKIDFDDYTSDILDDAIFDRNRLIENTLDCKIDVYCYGEDQGSFSMITNAVSAGDGSIDLSTGSALDAGNLMVNGWLLPFDYIESLDMTKPWWDESLSKDKSICGMTYFAMLDFLFDHYDGMAVLFYNKTLLEKYQLEDPYDLHKNQAWTTEKFMTMVEAATQDTNGDGMMTQEDDFGVYMVGGEGMPLLHASGWKMIEWDEEQNTFVLNMVQEQYINILEMITPIYNELGFPKLKFEGTTYQEIQTQVYNTFSNGTLLFLYEALGSFEDLRDTEDDYGLICLPRYDYSNPKAFVAACGQSLLLPRDVGDDNGDGVDDYNEIAAFLQAIGAYTYDVLIDIYKEKNVVGKGLRDEHSAEMFYEMIDRRGAELCIWYFQGYGFADTVNTQTDILYDGTGTGYGSAAQAYLKRFNAIAARLVKLVQEEVEKLGLN